MKKDEVASVTLRKILGICLVIIILLGVSVLAGNTKLNSVKIQFSNNHEITVLTDKTKVSEILSDNHVILLSNEVVYPGLDEEITDAKNIKISIKGTENAEVVKIAEKPEDKNIDEIKEKYKNITEKIVTIKEEIPFKTITKKAAKSSRNTVNTVIQYGQNGIKKITYKITYQNKKEINREELESTIIKKPINKIVEVQEMMSFPTSRSGSRVSGASGRSGVYKVTAYCACIQCCGKTNGITASGRRAQANHTVAAPGTFSFGTKIVMNGKTYVVEDRGGAIQGNRIDLYVNSHQEALRWGVRYVNVTVL